MLNLKHIPGCSHRCPAGKSLRQGPLHHCGGCGKLPAILGVLPFTKQEQAILDTRSAERPAKVSA